MAFGQGKDRESLDPTVTEIWEPVPPKVTPGEGTAPPSDAIILFDGTSLNNWTSENGGKAKWTVGDGAFTVKAGTGGIKTKQKFGDMQLHIEWRSPSEVKGEGQGRGNSGLFLMETYEVQILDSYESRTYSNGQAGSIYKQSIPLANATKPPGEWQTYDVIFMAPVFREDGTLSRPATVTVIHNGIVVQNHTTITGGTEYKGLPVYKAHGKKSIMLQDHGIPVSFRNIWVREL
ncbi:MAG: DUF1080 domain-containing protein [Bacteroidetes bacterium]|nr:DUF1080 domain-containing protein [Bacteroidota bacterium]